MKSRTPSRCRRCAGPSNARRAGSRRRRSSTASSTAGPSTRRRFVWMRTVLADLKRLIPLAPLHQPFALEAIEVLLAELPRLPQVACFDTAFHRTLPQVEQMLPLPYSLWERGIRRYGFHGLSYEYMAIALAERHGDVARGRTIVAHLGSGASLCAMHRLQSVATTMGFSALDGLMMGTRCGSLDPGVLLHLIDAEGSECGAAHSSALQRVRAARRVRLVVEPAAAPGGGSNESAVARGTRALRASHRARDRRVDCRARGGRHARLYGGDRRAQRRVA